MDLRIDTSTDSVLDREGDHWGFYQRSQQLFGGDETIVVAIQANEAFSPGMLLELERLSGEFDSVPGISRIDSLSTLPVVRVDELGSVELTPALTGTTHDLPSSVARAKVLSQLDRIIPGTLLSPDAKTAAIVLNLEAGVESMHSAILESIANLVPASGALVSGVPVFRVETNRITRNEILRFAPVTAAILGCFLYLMFRSVTAVLVGLLPGVAGAAVSISVMGLFGVPISITTMILPSMLIALGCAYSMHVLLANSNTRDQADLPFVLDPIALPLALSGLTTVVGLLSMTLVKIDAVRDAGLYGSIGVFIITLFSLTFLPAALRVVHPTLRSGNLQRRYAKDWSHAIVAFLERRRVLVLSVWAVIGVVLSIGISRINIETDPTTWLEISHPVRHSYDTIRSELSGISPMNVVISSVNDRSVLEPNALRSIDALSDFLESQPEVGKAVSIADPMRQLGRGFGDNSSMPLPSSRALAEQYMLLLEGVDLISNVVSSDRMSANIMLRVNDNGSSGILEVARIADEWWRQNGPDGYVARTTGIMFEFARSEDDIAYGQLVGLFVAVMVIFLVLLLIYRAPVIALIALVPNAIPLVVVFGIMGLLGISLDAGTVLIGGLALGIAVDDTIHLMTAFVEQVERRVRPIDALRLSFQSVLPAVLSSTALISAGFGVFVLSEFALTKSLGWLTSGIMVVCVVADISLLGALLIGRDWKRESLSEFPERCTPNSLD